MILLLAEENNVIPSYFSKPNLKTNFHLPHRQESNPSGSAKAIKKLNFEEPDSNQMDNWKIMDSNIPEHRRDELESKIKEEERMLNNYHRNNKKLRKTILSDIKEVTHDYDLSSRMMDKSGISKQHYRPNFNSSNHIELVLKESKTSPVLLTAPQMSANNLITEGNMNSGMSVRFNTQAADIEKPEKSKMKKKKEEKTVEEIQMLAGLVKVKFDWKKHDVPGSFQPWDCPSIKETKIEDVVKNYEKRRKLVYFCKNSFLKVYPAGKRIDSSNFDPVKSWICGAQFAAMNLQSLEEDYMLINSVFFKINNNCGYVLKPDFLRGIHLDYNRDYKSSRMKLSLQIISALNLHNCQKGKSIGDFHLVCYIIGSWEDDSLNSKFQSKKCKKNQLNSLFEAENYSFDVYEPELSFMIFKLVSDGDVFARGCVPVCLMKEGVRVLPIYDEMCKTITDAELVVRVKKTQV
jgi:hypothetical protein